MSKRMIRVGTGGAPSTPEGLAEAGHGEVRELWEANRTWLSPAISVYERESAFTLWNHGQQMVVPPRWRAIPGEYEAP